MVVILYFSGINPGGVDSPSDKDDVPQGSSPCKQLDYEDYANYLIVMSGDLLGNDFFPPVLNKVVHDSPGSDKEFSTKLSTVSWFQMFSSSITRS